MQTFESQLESLKKRHESVPVRVQTLGQFKVWVDGDAVASKAWGRDKAIQLFQFLIGNRHRKALHKEQIMDRLWEEDGESGDQSFKVALHGVNKVLEPRRKSHSEAQFISRQGQSYQLNTDAIWIDADALEQYIALGNQCLAIHPDLARQAYKEAIDLHHGVYLPERIYEDWSCDERERLQVLALGAMITLAELYLADNPLESIRLCQQALLLDAAWEDAYRIQMAAYYQKGNRPMAIKTFKQCEKILEEALGIDPLPETKKLYRQIIEA